MESLEAPPGPMPGDVGVGASALPLEEAPPTAAAGAVDEAGPGDETESVPDEDDERRRCLSEPEGTPLKDGGICDGEGDMEDDIEVGGTAVDEDGKLDVSAEAPP